MKKIGVFIAAVIIIALVCGGFFLATQRGKTKDNNTAEITEVQKLANKNLSGDYPVTPREVVKLYNRYIKCFYGDDYTDEEFDKLCSQTLELFDEELKANNPKDVYAKSVQDEVASYKKAKKNIYQTYVCDSNDVEYKTDGDDEIAYVEASYFIKSGNDFEKTFQEYILRKDANGNWKILGFYKIKGDSSTTGE